MSTIMDFLNTQAFTLGGTPVLASELIGFVLGVWTVWLVARANIWTFPIGIVQSVFFFVLFIESKLYSDAYLQVFFIVIQFVGWAAWLKAGPNRTKLSINDTPKWLMGATVAGIVVFAYFMIPILREAHGAYPVADSTSTGLSVAAQFLMTFKLIENWYLWIAADLIYIPLYAIKGLYFTSVLYVVFMVLCFMGLHHWRKVKRGDGEGRDPNSSRAVGLIETSSLEPNQKGWNPA